MKFIKTIKSINWWGVILIPLVFSLSLYFTFLTGIKISLIGMEISGEKITRIMDESDVLQILEIVLAVGAIIIAIVGYGGYKVISRELRLEAKQKGEEERILSTTETLLHLGYVLWFQFSKSEDKSFLKAAIKSAEKSLEYANRLDKEKHEEILCLSKNNLAFYLADEAGKKNFNNKERAIKLAYEAYKVAKSRRAKNYEQPYQWEETYAWVLWKFAGNDEFAKKRACEIIKILLESGDLPENFRNATSKRWNTLPNWKAFCDKIK